MTAKALAKLMEDFLNNSPGAGAKIVGEINRLRDELEKAREDTKLLDALEEYFSRTSPFLARLQQPRFDRYETNDYVCESSDCEDALSVHRKALHDLRDRQKGATDAPNRPPTPPQSDAGADTREGEVAEARNISENFSGLVGDGASGQGDDDKDSSAKIASDDWLKAYAEIVNRLPIRLLKALDAERDNLRNEALEWSRTARAVDGLNTTLRAEVERLQAEGDGDMDGPTFT